MFVTIFTFILVLSLLVFVHELGHFAVARKFGLKPREFGFGFPPRAIGYYKDAEGKWKKTKGSEEPEDAADTIYSINWLPLGGFVDLREDDEAEEGEEHFANLPVYQRFFILIAGVSMNILLAAVLISFGFMVGLPQATSDLEPGAKVSDEKVQIVEVFGDTPAEQAELEVGDVIVAINGQEISSNEQVQSIVQEKIGEDLVYTLSRGGEEIEKTITPALMSETGEGGIGVSITETGIVRYPFFKAIWEGFKSTIFLTWFIIVAFFELIKGLVLGQGVSIEVGGPIRIAEITGDAVRMGFSYLINFSALLSINLAIINAFPFPALDGGRIIFLGIEKLQGKPVSKKVEGAIHRTGFALLMILIVLVTYQDIARLFK